MADRRTLSRLVRMASTSRLGLALRLLALAAVMVPGAARAAVAGVSSPAVGVNPSNDGQMVFWRGEDGDIWESSQISDRQWRGPVDVTSLYGLGPVEAVRTSAWSTTAFTSWPSASSGLRVRSSRFPGALYAAGCETPSLCVMAGYTHAQGLPARLIVAKSGRVVRSAAVPHSSAGNNTSISCPSTRGCISVVPTDGTVWGGVISTISAAGRISSRVVSAPTGVEFNAISCTALTACELAGTNAGAGGEIAVASWNGHRLGKVHLAGPPTTTQTFGQGTALPTISCAGSHCEAAENLEVFDGNPDDYEGLLISLSSGRVTSRNLTPGYTVDSLSCGTAVSCWSILMPTTGATGGGLSQIRDNQPGPVSPIDIPAQSIGCQGSVCVIAGANQIETLAAGSQRHPQTVPGARFLTQVTANSNDLYAVVGAATTSGTLLVLAQPQTGK